jgi:hypothetical protein
MAGAILPVGNTVLGECLKILNAPILGVLSHAWEDLLGTCQT